MIDLNPDNLQTSINVWKLASRRMNTVTCSLSMLVSLSLHNDDNYVGSAARSDELVSVSQQLLDRTLTGADNVSDNVHNGCQGASSSSDWQICWLAVLLTRVHVSSVHWSMLRGRWGESCVSPSQLLDRVRPGLSPPEAGRAQCSDSRSVQDSPGAESLWLVIHFSHHTELLGIHRWPTLHVLIR